MNQQRCMVVPLNDLITNIFSHDADINTIDSSDSIDAAFSHGSS
jgi:hypothetical protein